MDFCLVFLSPLVVIILLSSTRTASTDDNSLATQWLIYKQEHGRSYSAAEDKARLAIFAANLAAIELINSDPSSSYKAGTNQFTDRTSAEVQQSLGLNPEPEPTSAPRSSRMIRSSQAPTDSATSTEAANYEAFERKKRGIIVTDEPLHQEKSASPATGQSTSRTTTTRTSTTGSTSTATYTRTTGTTTTGRTSTSLYTTTSTVARSSSTTTWRSTSTTTTGHTTSTSSRTTSTTARITTVSRTTSTTTSTRTTTITRTTATTTRSTTTTRTTTSTASTITTTTNVATLTRTVHLPNGDVIYYYYYYSGPTTTPTTTTTLAPPDAWDWTTASPPVVNTPEDQGSCGSCWAFATAGVIEGQYALKTGVLNRYSKQMFVDCSASNHGCQGGSLSYAIADFEYQHVESAAHYPAYTATQGTCRFDSNLAKQDMRFNMTARYFYGAETDMKHYVVTVGPLAVTMRVESPFLSYSSGVFSTACTGTSVNHGILLDFSHFQVGYGTDSNGVDFWKAKNSWGTAWGENGFFRIKRNAGNLCSFALRAVWPDLN